MTIPKQTLPKYTITLPASGKKVIFRPFTVKEEKILLLAYEEKRSEQTVLAISQIFDLCTFGVCKLEEMVQVDAEFLFINIRNKSLGEGVEVSHRCVSCDKKTHLLLDLENIEIVKGEEVSPNVKIDEQTIIQLSYPTIDKTIDVEDNPLLTAARCVNMMIIGEEVYNRPEYSDEDYLEYLESLSEVELHLLDDFFKSMPRVVFTKNYICPDCKTENTVIVEGLGDFFE